MSAAVALTTEQAEAVRHAVHRAGDTIRQVGVYGHSLSVLLEKLDDHIGEQVHGDAAGPALGLVLAAQAVLRELLADTAPMEAEVDTLERQFVAVAPEGTEEAEHA